VLQVDTTSGPSPFSRRDVALMLAIGSQAGMALGYARLHARVMEQQLLERDLELARKIQHHFLPPDAPAVPGYSFGVEYRPAFAVGGDLYDFLDLGDSRYAIVVGDVSGKGVSAALYAAKIITELRHLSAGAAGPAALLARVNEVLASRDHEGMFVTAVLAVLDAARRRFTVASAGHPLPYARDAAGQVVPVGRTGGAPLGMAPGIRFDEDEYELDPGDAVVLYTDGVTEALNSRNELFGDSRVAESVRRAGSGADAIVNSLDADARGFSRGTPQSDDVTIVAFSRD
jgi:phosphoserine phosphatase RsbU/P